MIQNKLIELLEPMQQGYLRLEMPDGTVREFGQSGATPSAHIRIRDAKFFERCLWYGDVGFGEAFVDGLWDTDNIVTVIKWLIVNLENCPGLSGSKQQPWYFNLLGLINRWRHKLRMNDVDNSRRNIHEHYDLSNEFFQIFLDASMTYSCAYFEKPDQTLEQAQAAKYDALCRKLKLSPDDHLLEIGCGWGGFSEYAATHYGCRITAITISEKQFAYAQQRFAEKGLSGRIDLRLQDYRHVQGTFTKIASIEMVEAVGDEFLETFVEQCHRLLTKDGLLGLQAITCPDTRFDLLRRQVDWIQKHIFPGSLLPSVGRLNQAMRRKSDFSLVGLEDMGIFYAKTLAVWSQTFNARLEDVRKLGFDHSFVRKWNYYLAYCQAAFATRHISVMQLVYARPNSKSLADLEA